MMIFLELYFRFFMVGLFSIGGGLATLPFLTSMGEATGWFDAMDISNMVAISESTPGPIGINMATYIGYEQGGFLGALLATVGVVLPSFIVILIVAAFIKSLLKYPAVKAFIMGMRPALGGLILSVAVTVALPVFFGIDTVYNIDFSFDWRTVVVLAAVITLPIIWKIWRKKEFSSILLVIISGVLGMLLFGI